MVYFMNSLHLFSAFYKPTYRGKRRQSINNVERRIIYAIPEKKIQQKCNKNSNTSLYYFKKRGEKVK